MFPLWDCKYTSKYRITKIFFIFLTRYFKIPIRVIIYRS